MLAKYIGNFQYQIGNFQFNISDKTCLNRIKNACKIYWKFPIYYIGKNTRVSKMQSNVQSISEISNLFHMS